MINNKHYFSKQLFGYLNEINGVVLKHLDGKTDADSHADIDVLLKFSEAKKVLEFVKKSPLIEQFKTRQYKSMIQLFIHFKDGSFLQLDVLFKLVRMQYEYLDTSDIFANKKENLEGIPIYSFALLLEHVVLFNFLNYSGVPQKYIEYFLSLSGEQQGHLLNRFNIKYKSAISSFAEFGDFDADLRKTLVKYLKSLPQNSIQHQVRHFAEYAVDKLKGLFQRTGKIITFSGVDGAGKSTIIDLTKKTLTEKYRKKVVVLRHRPSLLPILSAWRYGKKDAEQRATVALPHSGKNQSSLSSLFRFLYYYSDYLFGQVYVYAKYITRGYFVLYDRYYFDFIIDSKRSNLKVASGLTKPLYQFIQKPELNFFLFADANIIHARKQELPIATIETLTKKYCTLFEELDHKSSSKNDYLIIENIDKEKTLTTIMDYCKKVL